MELYDQNQYKRAAFPKDHAEQTGLSKREYFAIRCLQGMLCDSENYKKGIGEAGQDFLVKKSVEFADSLLRELGTE